jgi:hypothetical protein
MKDIMRDELGAPKIVDRSTFQAEVDALRVREKAHTISCVRGVWKAGRAGRLPKLEGYQFKLVKPHQFRKARKIGNFHQVGCVVLAHENPANVTLDKPHVSR